MTLVLTFSTVLTQIWTTTIVTSTVSYIRQLKCMIFCKSKVLSRITQLCALYKALWTEEVSISKMWWSWRLQSSNQSDSSSTTMILTQRVCALIWPTLCLLIDIYSSRLTTDTNFIRQLFLELESNSLLTWTAAIVVALMVLTYSYVNCFH